MARYQFKGEDARLWALVTATVRPREASRTPTKPEAKTETVQIPGMQAPMVAIRPVSPPLTPFRVGQAVKPVNGFRVTTAASYSPEVIEPNRKRRISRERDPIEARLDLHGLNSIAAEARLKAFVQQAYANDYRAVLVITGKGMAENGILKRNAPEWLADPALAHVVAGISQAHARHGGSGALYVALKRRAG